MTAEPIEQRHPLLDHWGPWSEEDYLALPEIEGVKLELVDGDLVMSPWPDNPHQRMVRTICAELDRQAPDGYEALPGANVRLAPGRISIPDVVLTTIGDRTVNETGDVLLVVEVESDSGRGRDRILKPALYADARIPWYLRVERLPVLMLVLHRLEADRNVEEARASAGQHVEVPELGITIEVDGLLPHR